MRFIKLFFNIFFPDLCRACNNILLTEEKIICSNCRHILPQSEFHKYDDNPVKKIFYGRVNVQFASSFLIFHKKGLVQKLIHNLKYKGQQDIGTTLGYWYGEKLKRETNLKIDFVVGVPLHKKKEKKRGYNQVDTFSIAIAKCLNAKYSKNNLIRVYNSKTQTKKSRLNRWENMKEIFFLQDINMFENKNILLIDDIITTGATLEACSNEILKSKNVTINIVTIAIAN